MLVSKKCTKKVVAMMMAMMVGVSGMAVGTAEADAAVQKPARVKNVRVVDETDSTLKVKWNKQRKISGKKVKYKVSYKEAKGGSWKTKLVKKNKCTIKNLEDETKYNIRVQAYYKKGGKTYIGKQSKLLRGTTEAHVVDVDKELLEGGIKPELIDDVKDKISTQLGDGAETIKNINTDKIVVNGIEITVADVDYLEDGTTLSSEYFAVIGDSVYPEVKADRIIESCDVVLNGQDLSFSTGGSVEVPNASGSEKISLHDVAVEKITSDDYAISGTTDSGARYRLASNGGVRYVVDSGLALNRLPMYDHDFTVTNGSYDLSSKGGTCMYVKSNDPDINIYWTCDGTEPSAGQEDLYGSCRYTRYTTSYTGIGGVSTPDKAYQETQLRGTTSYGESHAIFSENGSLDDENKFWIKVYKGDTLVFEEFKNTRPNGYDESELNGKKQECIDRYHELIAYEMATYGEEFPSDSSEESPEL